MPPGLGRHTAIVDRDREPFEEGDLEPRHGSKHHGIRKTGATPVETPHRDGRIPLARHPRELAAVGARRPSLSSVRRHGPVKERRTPSPPPRAFLRRSPRRRLCRPQAPRSITWSAVSTMSRLCSMTTALGASERAASTEALTNRSEVDSRSAECASRCALTAAAAPWTPSFLYAFAAVFALEGRAFASGERPQQLCAAVAKLHRADSWVAIWVAIGATEGGYARTAVESNLAKRATSGWLRTCADDPSRPFKERVMGSNPIRATIVMCRDIGDRCLTTS